jgi:hypothetical protein
MKPPKVKDAQKLTIPSTPENLQKNEKRTRSNKADDQRQHPFN